MHEVHAKIAGLLHNRITKLEKFDRTKYWNIRCSFREKH